MEKPVTSRQNAPKTGYQCGVPGVLIHGFWQNAEMRPPASCWKSRLWDILPSLARGYGYTPTLDKHYLRKHGAKAYYGRGGCIKTTAKIKSETGIIKLVLMVQH